MLRKVVIRPTAVPPRAIRSVLISLLVLCACTNVDPFEPSPDATHVQLNDNSFAPQTVTVAVGKPVAWTNSGQLSHRVVFDGVDLSTREIRPRAWAELRFDAAGTLTYHCDVHPQKTGTVIVQ